MEIKKSHNVLMADREESEREKVGEKGSPPTTGETKCLAESSAGCLADE